MILLPDSSDEEIAAAYERHFAALARIAKELNVPAEEADTLINTVLLGALRPRAVSDVEMWLRAALTSALEYQRGQA